MAKKHDSIWRVDYTEKLTSQVVVAIFLGQDEGQGVVSVTATGMDWKWCRFVDNQKIMRIFNNLNGFCCHRHLMPVKIMLPIRRWCSNITFTVLLDRKMEKQSILKIRNAAAFLFTPVHCVLHKVIILQFVICLHCLPIHSDSSLFNFFLQVAHCLCLKFLTEDIQDWSPIPPTLGIGAELEIIGVDFP